MPSLQSWKSFLFAPLLGSIWMCFAERDCSMWESHHQLFSIRWDGLVAEHKWEDKQKVQLLAQPYSLLSPLCRKGQEY